MSGNRTIWKTYAQIGGMVLKQILKKQDGSIGLIHLAVDRD